MKKVFFIIFIFLYMIYNIPIMVLFYLISMWHWDVKYINGFFEGMRETFDSINPL